MQSPFSLLTSWILVTAAVAAAALPRAPLSREEQNALVNDFCSGCHSEKTKKGDLILEGFDAASPFLGAELLEKMILKVRTGAMPPPSSNRPEAALLAAFVETLEARADASAERANDPGWRPFQRLNRAEYSRAIRDLLGIEIDAATFLPADTTSAGFDNIADVQTASPTVITAYLRGAATVSRLAVGRSRALSCAKTEASTETKCAAAIIRKLSDSAYRGFATSEDRAVAMGFYERGRASGGFESGVRLALQSILANPKFLFRLEPRRSAAAGDQSIDDKALASRLSFFLWSSGPDARLLAAAARGDLRTASGIEREVVRMLADPRADSLATRFAAQWLCLQDLEKSVPDPGLFPTFDVALSKAMRRETEMFVTDVFRSDRSILSLITSDRSFINQRLADHYGLPGVSGSLDDTVRPDRDGVPLSTRQRVEEHRRSPACASCHRTIDPPGLTLEGFDATGATRRADNGVPVDSAADLADGQRVVGPAGLRTMLLAHEDQILRNFAAQLLTYALNRRVNPRDMREVRAIVRRAGSRGNRASEFILGVVTGDAFRKANPPKES